MTNLSGQQTQTQQTPTAPGQREIKRPEHMQGETGGQLVIKDDVVARIAGMAAREIEGVSFGSGGLVENITGAARERVSAGEDVKKGIKAEVGERQAAFDMSIIVDYGYNIPRLVQEIRRRVSQKVEEMCDLETTEINVEVADIRLPSDKPEPRVE